MVRPAWSWGVDLSPVSLTSFPFPLPLPSISTRRRDLLSTGTGRMAGAARSFLGRVAPSSAPGARHWGCTISAMGRPACSSHCCSDGGRVVEGAEWRMHGRGNVISRMVPRPLLRRGGTAHTACTKEGVAKRASPNDSAKAKGRGLNWANLAAHVWAGQLSPGGKPHQSPVSLSPFLFPSHSLQIRMQAGPLSTGTGRAAGAPSAFSGRVLPSIPGA